MSIDPKQFAEWKALAEAATEGPWSPWRSDDNATADYVIGHCTKSEPHGPGRRPERNAGCGAFDTYVVTTDSGVYTHNEADIDFIAAARTAVPALIAEVERLSAILGPPKSCCGHLGRYASQNCATGPTLCPSLER